MAEAAQIVHLTITELAQDHHPLRRARPGGAIERNRRLKRERLVAGAVAWVCGLRQPPQRQVERAGRAARGGQLCGLAQIDQDHVSCGNPPQKRRGITALEGFEKGKHIRLQSGGGGGFGPRVAYKFK